MKRKRSKDLVETIELANKNKNWNIVAGLLSGPTKKFSKVNLSKIDKESKENETVIVVGKILSLGEITKKIKISSYQISDSALKKINKSKIEYISLNEEIKKNPNANKIKIIK